MWMRSGLLSSICLLLLLFLLFGGCKREKPGSAYDVVSSLQPIARQVIVPRHQEFQRETVAFSQQADQYLQQPDSQQLLVLREAFLDLYVKYSACEPFIFGEIKSLFVHNRMAKWPCDTDQIEQSIASPDSIHAGYIATLGSTSRGLASLEYLLYAKAADSTHLSFTRGVGSMRRRGFLAAIAADLEQKATQLADFWGNSGTYAERWVNSTETGTQAPMALFANSLIAMTQNIAQKKIGGPLGKFDMNPPRTDELQAHYSRHSLALIKKNVETLKVAFDGVDQASGINAALDALEAKYGEQKLSEAISERFLQVQSELGKLAGTSLYLVIENEPQRLEALYAACRELLVMMKADLVSALSITLTVSDNDGD